MTLAAHEDKTYRGGYIASPSMPWVWATTAIENPSGAYHLVWSRDLYQIATALLAAGDRAGAERALDLPVQAPAEGRRLLPAELDGRRQGALDQPPARPGRVPDRARVAARARGRHDLQGRRQARRRLHPRQRAADPAGALGEPGRLVAGDDRLGDRGARRPARTSRAPTATRSRRRRGRPRPTSGQAKVDAWTYTTTGPYGEQALLPSPHQGREPRTRAPRTTSATAARTRRPAQGRRSELPRARAPRRQAGGRPAHPSPRSPWSTTSSAVDDAQRPVLAPLQLRRLRRAEGRQRVELRLPAQHDAAAEVGEQRHDRAHLADLRGRARRVRGRRAAVRPPPPRGSPRWRARAATAT